MTKIPFKVSARAARLIGRENIATSQGAITELVKNSYDADATACAILFVRRYIEIPSSLTTIEFGELAAISKKAKQFYEQNAENYTLLTDISDSSQEELNAIFDDLVDLWIVDNGRGMSAKIIEDQWMVIGTDFKERTSKSDGGRILTGAKGIGRFALDRLGRECELFSAEKLSSEIVHWVVDWGDFEGAGKIIDDVTAILEMEDLSYSEALQKECVRAWLPTEQPTHNDEQTLLKFEHGTAVGIRHLHDVWDRRDSLKLRETLEALLPPKDQRDFGIYVFDHRNIEENGWINSTLPDQFDFRLHANVAPDGIVAITIDRQEIDVPKIRPSFFSLPAMTKPGYAQTDFDRGTHSYETTLSKLISLEEGETQTSIEAVGPMEFTLYYFKLANPTSDNLLRFPQKSFDVTKRKRWLRNSGGIRLYRDQFRVRPYGEPNTQGSDWLLLGQRVAQNPSAVSRLSWRVPPQQVAGTIHISKENNPLLADQSNREGIMNERAFALFRRVILALIGEFEKDRSYIYHHFDKAYNLDHPNTGKLERGKKLAEKVLKDQSDQKVEKQLAQKQSKDEKPSANDDNTETSIPLAEALDISQRENVDLKDEIQVLRGMATLGTVLVSFTHELKQIKANMGSRQKRMENALNRVVDEQKIRKLPKLVNPYDILNRWGREDEKVSRWVDFALSSVSLAKRRRRPIAWDAYLVDLKSYWCDFFVERSIELSIPIGWENDPKILAHEIDLDSIFYNLIVNSFEAFSIPSSVQNRHINILCKAISDDHIVLEYSDNGPGIPNDFNIAEDIFIFGSSSKREKKNNDVTGTGIGMWLIKSIINDYSGTVELLSEMGQQGFKIAITLPLYKKAV